MKVITDGRARNGDDAVQDRLSDQEILDAGELVRKFDKKLKGGLTRREDEGGAHAVAGRPCPFTRSASLLSRPFSLPVSRPLPRNATRTGHTC